ncbi:hypothetical protein IW262DRAFT_504134 [Armillaria fumosa]|nr:hypothetical protein IW262DRAFT_504134 [Armillaria fumosa]
MRLAVRSVVLLFQVLLSRAVSSEDDIGSKIARGDHLLSTGQYQQAAKVYSSVIVLSEYSPNQYIFYSKRATAYFSLGQHAMALNDFNRVLTLTAQSFTLAYIMKAQIHTKDGHFLKARGSLQHFIDIPRAESKHDIRVSQLLADISQGEILAKNIALQREYQLWDACLKSTEAALKISSHSIAFREARAECSIAAGDFSGAVTDLIHLTQFLPPSSSLHTRIFQIGFFFLSPSSADIYVLRQCLRFDPESKSCLSLFRLARDINNGFTRLEKLLYDEDWKGVIELLTGNEIYGGLMQEFDDAVDNHIHSGQTSSLDHDSPIAFSSLPSPRNISPRRQLLVRSLCRAYTNTNSWKMAHQWCVTLLAMDGCADDVDGLRGRDTRQQKEWDQIVGGRHPDYEPYSTSQSPGWAPGQGATSYHEILGIDQNADYATIRKAFRNAALKAHPDKGGSESRMAAVNEAYEVLSQRNLRARFDWDDTEHHEYPNMAPYDGFLYAQARGGGVF